MRLTRPKAVLLIGIDGENLLPSNALAPSFFHLCSFENFVVLFLFRFNYLGLLLTINFKITRYAKRVVAVLIGIALNL